MRRLLLLAVAATLPACTLIDQRTFNPQAGRRPFVPGPASSPTPAPELGPPPLLTISVPASPQRLRPEVAKAVRAAVSRKRDVTFEVVEITPGAGPVGQEAAEIARLITAEGVPARRVRLAARPVANAAREVRVYVH